MSLFIGKAFILISVVTLSSTFDFSWFCNKDINLIAIDLYNKGVFVYKLQQTLSISLIFFIE